MYLIRCSHSIARATRSTRQQLSKPTKPRSRSAAASSRVPRSKSARTYSQMDNTPDLSLALISLEDLVDGRSVSQVGLVEVDLGDLAAELFLQAAEIRKNR